MFFRSEMNKSIPIIALASLMLFSTSIFSSNYNAFGEVINDHGHLHTLKEQLIDYKPGEKIICPNPDHVIVLRPNTQWACVFPETAQHLKWNIVTFLEFGSPKITTHVSHDDQYYDVSYQISNGLVNSIVYSLDFNSLTIEITSTKGGEFNLTIPTGLGELFEEGICERNNQIPGSEEYMVLLDGEEIESETTEVNKDLINVKIQYGVNAKTIEIIQACLV